MSSGRPHPCVDGAAHQPVRVAVSKRGQDPGASWGQSSVACSMLNATVVCGFTSAPPFSPLTQCFLSDISEQRPVAPKKEREIGRPPGDPPFPGRFRNSGADEWQEGKPTLAREAPASSSHNDLLGVFHPILHGRK